MNLGNPVSFPSLRIPHPAHAEVLQKRALDFGLPAPRASMRSCVVVPARNEEASLPALIATLADQHDLRGEPLDPTSYEVVLLLNNCTDRTAAIARQLQRQYSNLRFHVAEIDFVEAEAHVGRARQALFDWAFARFQNAQNPHGLILTTDADSQPARDWIAQNEAEIALGVAAVGGRILLDARGRAKMNPVTRRLFLLDVGYRRALEELRSLYAPEMHDPFPRHHQHFGGSLAITAAAYAAAGGMPLRRSSEDVALYQAVVDSGGRFRHSEEVRVYTSARAIGRAQGGLADAISWWNELALDGTSVMVESAPDALDRLAMLGIWCAENFDLPAPAALATTPVPSKQEGAEIHTTLLELRVMCEALRGLSHAERLAQARARLGPPAEACEKAA
jgi:hypothetical protein